MKCEACQDLVDAFERMLDDSCSRMVETKTMTMLGDCPQCSTRISIRKAGRVSDLVLPPLGPEWTEHEPS